MVIFEGDIWMELIHRNTTVPVLNSGSHTCINMVLQHKVLSFEVNSGCALREAVFVRNNSSTGGPKFRNKTVTFMAKNNGHQNFT